MKENETRNQRKDAKTPGRKDTRGKLMSQESIGFMIGECGASHEELGTLSKGLQNAETTATFNPPHLKF